MQNELQPASSGGLPAIDEHAEARASFLYSLTGQTPWWIVSVLLHAMIIVLAALLSIAIELPTDDGGVVMISDIGDIRKTQIEPPATAPKPSDPLAPTENPSNGTAKTDVNMLIPQEMLDRAIEGIEFRTKDDITYEFDGAHGEQDAKVFYASATGQSGGGGTNGATLMDESIGTGSAGSAGSGGGWGGGKGSGVGPGEGSGKASWGFKNRGSREWMVKRNNIGHGPNPIPSTDFALDWLAYHQEADGHWDATKYGAAVKTDTAVTSLSLLAFLGSGHTERVGKHKGTVQKAIAWLKSKQAADGCIWDTSDDGAGHRRVGYPSAIATMAMAEAAGMGSSTETRVSAQKAIDYATSVHQTGEGYEKGGWRYAPKSEGDLSVSGWFIMALKSAKVAGLNVPAASFDGAIKFLDSVEVKEADNSGYPVSRYKYMVGNEHGHTGHRLTAIGTLARQFMGWKKDDLQGSVDWFVNKGGVPSFGANGESVDLYYWYYGTMCVFQQGGDVWKRWNAGMLKALLENQCKQGDANGSWNPSGEYSTEWGRVGQTALSALCLEVYYRYDMIKAGK